MLLKVTDYFLLIIGSILLFLFSSTLWFENYFFNTKPIIYIIFIIFIILNITNLFKYLLKVLRENFKNLDFFIIISILLHFLIQRRINYYGISFLALYVFISSLSPYMRESNSRVYKLILSCIFFSGMMSLTGVYLGFLESLFLDTGTFHQYQPPGYPNPTSDFLYKITGFSLSNHISGFQISINYSAYIIISCLGVLNFMQYKTSLKKILRVFLIIGLILIQAKIGFLFMMILIVMHITKKFQRPVKFLLIFSICICYLLLTHITVIDSNSVIVSSKYYREFVFSFLNMDFYLSLFSWLKVISLKYLLSSNIFFTDLNGFFKLSEGNEPHSLFFSSSFFGGLIFASLVTIRLINNLSKYFLSNLERDIYFSTLLCVFCIESILWDSYDAPIFWLIILLSPYYKNIIKKVSKT
jgi:hypothetical protein